MKKILFILLLTACGAGMGYAQSTTYNFQYIPNTGTPSCNPDWYDWYVSHGSPSYVSPDYAKLASSNGKSEGMFVYYNFSKNNNYQITLGLKYEANARIEIYGAYGLTVNKDPGCNEATQPIPAYKQLIAGGYIGDCGVGVYCNITVPDTPWNPNGNYNSLWITSNNPGNTSYFIINKVTITDLGKVESTPPTVPGNLRTKSVEATKITVQWDPSYDASGVAGYEVFLNGTSNGKTGDTEYTFTRLTECTRYTIEVRAYDPYDNYSGKAKITVQTPEDLPADLVLDSPINLSTYPNKRYTPEATNTITMKHGFSVKANDAQEYFHASISTGCKTIIQPNLSPDGEEVYFVEDADFVEDTDYSISLVPDAGSDILIYPNPTTGMITVEYHQFTGVENMLVFDITGKLVLDCRLSGSISNVDVSAFSAGIYFIKVVTQDQVFVKKLLKQ